MLPGQVIRCRATAVGRAGWKSEGATSREGRKWKVLFTLPIDDWPLWPKSCCFHLVEGSHFSSKKKFPDFSVLFINFPDHFIDFFFLIIPVCGDYIIFLKNKVFSAQILPIFNEFLQQGFLEQKILHLWNEINLPTSMKISFQHFPWLFQTNNLIFSLTFPEFSQNAQFPWLKKVFSNF